MKPIVAGAAYVGRNALEDVHAFQQFNPTASTLHALVSSLSLDVSLPDLARRLARSLCSNSRPFAVSQLVRYP